ncbi:hypothetical protein AB0C60_07960, partial [Streptomyces sp. NPDC048845]
EARRRPGHRRTGLRDHPRREARRGHQRGHQLRTSTVEAIDALGVSVDVAWAPQSVTVLLADDLDVSRGDVIATTATAPAVTQDLEATVCHLHDRPLRTGDRVLLKHTTRTVKAIVKDIPSRLNLAVSAEQRGISQHPAPEELAANDIGRVVLRTSEPLPVDAYADSRRTGSFLLIDPADGTTLTAGMAGAAFADSDAEVSEAPAAGADGDWDF